MPYSDAGVPLGADQLRLQVVKQVGADIVPLGTYLVPEIAGAPLLETEAVGLCFRREDSGASVMIDVEGLREGVVVGTGAATLTLQAGEVVYAVVPLT